MQTSLVEARFGLNNFNKPKTDEDEAALATTILMILFGRPGVFPSIPDIGMHIQDYFYKFEEDVDVGEIKVQLAYQCSLVNELSQLGTFDVQKLDDNGRMVLLFLIPSLQRESDNLLVIGVTTNLQNSVVYNFDLVETDFYEN